jgi:hypothetical protein
MRTTNRKIQLLIVIIITIHLFFTGPAQANGGVTVNLTPEKDQLTVGDRVQLTLAVNHPVGYQVIIPQLDHAWGDVEVFAQSQPQTTTNSDGSETTRQTIEVALFAPGTFQTPPLRLTLSDNNGQISEETVPPLSLTVTPVLAEEDDILRDIKPQVDMPVPARWPWLVAGVLAALLLLAGIWWLFRRLRRRQLTPVPVVDTRPPYQVAYDELARIEALQLPAQGRFKEYYTLVTDCLRQYLEQQHRIRAFDRTTTELKQILSRSTLASEHARRIVSLFTQSDLVKFAKFIPSPGEAAQITGQARRLVDDTHSNGAAGSIKSAGASPAKAATASPVNKTINSQ